MRAFEPHRYRTWPRADWQVRRSRGSEADPTEWWGDWVRDILRVVASRDSSSLTFVLLRQAHTRRLGGYFSEKQNSRHWLSAIALNLGFRPHAAASRCSSPLPPAAGRCILNSDAVERVTVRHSLHPNIKNGLPTEKPLTLCLVTFTARSPQSLQIWLSR